MMLWWVCLLHSYRWDSWASSSPFHSSKIFTASPSHVHCTHTIASSLSSACPSIDVPQSFSLPFFTHPVLHLSFRTEQCLFLPSCTPPWPVLGRMSLTLHASPLSAHTQGGTGTRALNLCSSSCTHASFMQANSMPESNRPIKTSLVPPCPCAPPSSWWILITSEGAGEVTCPRAEEALSE